MIIGIKAFILSSIGYGILDSTTVPRYIRPHPVFSANRLTGTGAIATATGAYFGIEPDPETPEEAT